MRVDKKLFWIIIIVAAISGFLLIAFLFVFPPIFVKNVVDFCQNVITNLSSSWVEVLTFVTAAFLALKVTFSLARVLVLFYKSRQERKSLLKEAIPLTARLKKVAGKLADTGKIDLVQDKRLMGFCYGVFAPRILISTALCERLSDDELEVVLAHETCHLKRKDPLRIFLAQLAISVFSFMPVVRRLLTDFKLSVEISADNFAGLKTRKPQALRLALAKTVNSSFHPPFAPSLIPTQTSLWQARINHLTNPGSSRRDKPVSLFPVFLVWTFALLLIFAQVQKPKGVSQTKVATKGCFADADSCTSVKCDSDETNPKSPLTFNSNPYYTL